MMGAAYVHTLSGADTVGIALSYAWGYKIGDIIGTLEQHCKIKSRTAALETDVFYNDERESNVEEEGSEAVIIGVSDAVLFFQRVGLLFSSLREWENMKNV